MKVLLAIVIGSITGALFGDWKGAMFCGTLGLFAGVWWATRTPSAAMQVDGATPLPPNERMAKLELRVRGLELALQRVLDERAASGAAAPARASSTAASDGTVVTPASTGDLAAVDRAAVDAASSIAAMQSTSGTAVTVDTPQVGNVPDTSTLDTTEPIAVTPVQAAPVFAPPPLPPAPPGAIMRFITGGNTLARIGVLLLFIGVGFMVKYAAEHAHFPIEWRLAALGVAAIVMLAVGWRLRDKRPAYAMIVQGGAIGVLYLTVFAALQLYHLLPPAFAFGLLLWIALTAAILAVRQDSLALAIVGVSGGFLAPLLASTGDGNHVQLFGFYLALNVGILAIAWFKTWRLLNVIGFAFTFAVGLLWGSRFYRPELFASTEPFLVAYFLFYLAIPILYALRSWMSLRNYVDGTLVFGTPLAVAALQSALVRDIPFGMAFSAIALSAVYIIAATVLYARRGEALRHLVEAFVALGVLFATLAIPLAFDARTTTALWALEGAGITWVGMRQQRRNLRIIGIALQGLAGWIFAAGFELWPGQPTAVATTVLPIVNSAFIGCVLLAVAGLLTAWWYHRAIDSPDATRHGVGLALFTWGWLWWLFGCAREIDRLAPNVHGAAVMVIVLAATAVVAFAAALRWQWLAARMPARALPVMLLAFALWRLDAAHTPLLGGWGWVAWPLALLALAWLLRRDDAGTGMPLSRFEVEWQHAVAFWLVSLLITDRMWWFAEHATHWTAQWRGAVLLAVPALALAAITRLSRGDRWPLAPHRTGYLAFGGTVTAVLLALAACLGNIASNGDASPLPFLPIFNPIDLALLLSLFAIAAWLLRVQALWPARHVAVRRGGYALGVLAFLWLNGALLRTVHQWTGIAYDPFTLLDSMLVQATLSILWSLVALGLMAYAHRTAARLPWMIGGALLAVVILKLFVVDLSNVGGLPRIVSFLGVGLLVLLIGYVAPVPPRKLEAS